MYLKELKIEGFKSFGKAATLTFPSRITAIVGPNGSGKSNVTEAFRFVLGEQSMKSMRGKRGEDLIFNGGMGASRSPRAAVTVVLDNRNRVLYDTFDEIAVSRVVHRDGSNEYTINGTKVRHRDIVEMFSRANIGSTGHHIISQGESDRILNASPEERKEILEDGLGLKLLQFRRAEAQKRLNRARKNISETDIVLREILPHLRSLKRQIDRYESARALREELEGMYAEYLVRETAYITATRETLGKEEREKAEEVGDLEKRIQREKGDTDTAEADALTARMRETRDTLQSVRVEKDAAVHELGQIEGEREALTLVEDTAVPDSVPRDRIAELRDEVEARKTGDHSALIAYIIRKLGELLQTPVTVSAEVEERLTALTERHDRVRKTLSELEAKEKEHTAALEAFQKQQEGRISALQETEKTLMRLMTEKNTAEQHLAAVRYNLETLETDGARLREELAEGAVLIGSAVERYKTVPVPDDAREEPREKQKERRRLLERRKIQLESIGTDSGEEVYAEYKEVSERVEFLNRERDDLLASIRDCEECIAGIQEEIEKRFVEGIRKISAEFDRFFKTLFNGGKASIGIEKRTVVREDEEPEERVGIGVSLSLPRKKIHSLDQLSGGERALVSIALLFAISQVTPPPFLILDETDAALDEANARRYTSIIRMLAEQSQLVLITHNRETMQCADTLYGVTMNSVGISALLSVRFEEAVQVAK